MITYADKTAEDKNQAVANRVSNPQRTGESASQLVDNRPEAIAQRKIQEVITNSAYVKQLKASQKKASDFSLQAAQRKEDRNVPIQRVLNVNGVPVSRDVIAGQQAAFKESCSPLLAQAGYEEVSEEQWTLIFQMMDAVAADPREFNFTGSSQLMIKILEGKNIEQIAAEHVQQVNENPSEVSTGKKEPTKKDAKPEKENEVRKIELAEGVFSGSFECGPNRNWADLHVTGATGGKADKGALLRYFSTVYELMLGHFKFSGVPGVLEWHPTGAVVTKQIVELLGESVGGWYEWGKAKYEQEKRRSADKKNKPQRNNLAGKISPEFVAEHMHFLKSLKGAKGLSITAKGLPLPPEVIELLQSEKGKNIQGAELEALISPDMTSNSPEGNAMLASYEQALNDPERDDGPSLAIKLDFRELPKLMKKLS